MRRPVLALAVVLVAVAALALVAVAGLGGLDDLTGGAADDSEDGGAGQGDPGTAPLTGLPLAEAVAADRPALVVKIDNAEAARPQSGLVVADVVFEELVEGGATRFAAVFHSRAADPVGPVRSARSTDVDLVESLNRPIFAWSGANAGVADEVDDAALVDVGADAAPGAYRRVDDRRAPHNLMTGTDQLHAAAPDDAGGVPPALFVFRAAGAAPAAGQAVAGADLAWGGPVDLRVGWRYDPVADGWARTQQGRPHTVASGEQVTPENVVLQFVDHVDSGFVDTTGAPSPEAELVGRGEVWVLTAGRLVRGTWQRLAPAAVASYTDAAGDPIALTPGRTWVELLPPGRATIVP